MMNYQEAWQFLDDLQFFKIKLGLESMTDFLESLGQPQHDIPFVHVAGTNGKGSVSMTMLTILAQAGYRVGLYTSPHLSSVRERFRTNDNYISREDFARLASEIKAILNGRQITYFEFTTALAMLWFQEQQVDLAILEVGLGGRLDATNVIAPLVSIITNVSMDHQVYLGNTITQIASEKAGIIKRSVPVVTAVSGHESLEVLELKAAEQKAPLYLFGRDFHVRQETGCCWSYQSFHLDHVISGLKCRMKGQYQLENAALAIAAIELLAVHGFKVTENTIRESLLKVHWPGRLEYFCLARKNGNTYPCAGADLDVAPSRRQYLLDGAHNPDGVRSLKETLRNEFNYNRLLLVWASMADKDMAGTLSIISPLADRMILTMPESERSARPEQLAALLPENIRRDAILTESVALALEQARELAQPDDLICIAGSLYLIGAARSILLGDIIHD